jgi:dynein heavy chain
MDTLCYDFEVMPPELTVEAVEDPPEFGCFIYGLYLDGARYNSELHALDEQEPKILFYSVPMMKLMPVKIEEKEQKHIYTCPIYKTSKRYGVLLTTGHSTNFVMPADLPIQAEHKQEHWIKRGVAMLCQLDY